MSPFRGIHVYMILIQGYPYLLQTVTNDIADVVSPKCHRQPNIGGPYIQYAWTRALREEAHMFRGFSDCALTMYSVNQSHKNNSTNRNSPSGMRVFDDG